MNTKASLSFFIFTLLGVLAMAAPQSAQTQKATKATKHLSLYFDVQGEQAFVLKQRSIKNKPEYFLLFVRGKQTYGSVLISKKQFERYRKTLEAHFLTSKSKSRRLASVDSCHQQVAYQGLSALSPTSVCWSDLSTTSQKKLKALVADMNKKLYGVSRYDLL